MGGLPGPRRAPENGPGHLAARGVDQRFVAMLDAEVLRVTVTRNGAQGAEVSIPRDHLVAFGAVFGLTVYTTTGAVALPAEWAASNGDWQRAPVRSLAARLNRAVAAS